MTAKHWRVQYKGGPLNGKWHESLAAMVPAKIGSPTEGGRYMHWYSVDVDHQSAHYIETTDEWEAYGVANEIAGDLRAEMEVQEENDA